MKDYTKYSLQEGNTPLLRLYTLEKYFRWSGKLWGKAEYQNPTGSFKDRGSLVEICDALQQKKAGVVCASTGNMAASLSAYASRAQLPCIVVVPKETPKQKLSQAIVMDAQIVDIDGSYDECVKVAERIAMERNYLLCGDYQRRRIGQRSIGVELAESGISFDGCIIPVGNGTIGCAVVEGLVTSGTNAQFIGVQAYGANSVYTAWEKQMPIIPLPFPQTVASAMNVGNPLDGQLTLYWINQTKGRMVQVSDTEILEAQNLLAQKEGIFVEPSSAATVAALPKLPDRSLSLVLVLTGHGLKGGEN